MAYILLTWLFAPLLWLSIRRARTQQRRVLLIQTAKIGDLVCTTPIIASLKASWPDCHLTVMLNPLCAPLLAHDPAVDDIWAVAAADWRGLAGKWRLLRRLRAGRFDDCIVLSPNTAFLLLPFWAGIPRRAAMLGNFPSRSLDRCRPFLTHHERHRAGQLVLATELTLLRQLGCTRHSSHKQLHAAPAAARAIDALLGSGSAPRIGIGISAGNPMKALSAAQLSGLCNALLRRLPHDLILIGTAADRATAAAILEACDHSARIIDASGALTLDELPALMPRLSVYFGVDSGVTYIADACAVPTVDLMGPANPEDQRPTGEQVIVLSTDLPCAPCSHAFRAPYQCARGDRACVTEADLQRIADSVVRLAANPDR